MGLLDDAIREHLELKRRRGADPSEVARQEQEAFGAPRRGDFAVATAEPALDAPAAAYDEIVTREEPSAHDRAEPAAAPTTLHVVEDPFPLETEPPRPHGDPAAALPEPDDAPSEAHHAPPEPAVQESAPPPAAAAQEKPAQPAGAEPDQPADVEQPTRAFDAEEVRAATMPPPVAPAEDPAPLPPEPELTEAPPAAREEAAPPEAGEEGEDVLEETPEFLQETPEHDRLWFEQRPPRDFDF